MKKCLKVLLSLILATAVVVGISCMSSRHFLKASDDDGSSTAIEQQEAYVEEYNATVEVPQREEPAPVQEQFIEEDVTISAEEPSELEAIEWSEEDSKECSFEEVTEVFDDFIDPALFEVEDTTVNCDAEVSMENAGDIYYGDMVVLSARVSIDSGVDYSLRWQYNDGAGWKNIEGANDYTYEFEISEQNSLYDYRVVVDY